MLIKGDIFQSQPTRKHISIFCLLQLFFNSLLENHSDRFNCLRSDSKRFVHESDSDSSPALQEASRKSLFSPGSLTRPKLRKGIVMSSNRPSDSTGKFFFLSMFHNGAVVFKCGFVRSVNVTTLAGECDTSRCFPQLSGMTLIGRLKAQQKLTL